MSLILGLVYVDCYECNIPNSASERILQHKFAVSEPRAEMVTAPIIAGLRPNEVLAPWLISILTNHLPYMHAFEANNVQRVGH